MNDAKKAQVWLFSLLDSLRADLRIEGKHELADKIRDKMKAIGINSADLPVLELEKYRDAYRLHRNMPNASFMELEMLI